VGTYLIVSAAANGPEIGFCAGAYTTEACLSGRPLGAVTTGRWPAEWGPTATGSSRYYADEQCRD